MMYDLRDEKQAKEYLKNISTEFSFQCYKEKQAEGCHRLADFHESVKKEYDKAAILYKTTCDDQNYGHSCFKYGNYKIAGRGGEKNEDEGLKYHLKGCENGYVPACHNAGLLYGSGKSGSIKDIKKAVKYFEKGCQGNHDHSCYQLSGYYIKGSQEISKDMKKAFEYSDKACGMGHMYACANLSQMYKKGDGVVKDMDMAEKYRKKATEIYDSVTQGERTIKFSE